MADFVRRKLTQPRKDDVGQLLGLLGAWYLSDTTQAGADLATYQRAGDALYTTGDPYAYNDQVPEDYRYRYPPLLAMVIPVLGWPPLWFAIIGVAIDLEGKHVLTRPLVCDLDFEPDPVDLAEILAVHELTRRDGLRIEDPQDGLPACRAAKPLFRFTNLFL